MAKVLIINPNVDTFGRQSIPTALIAALLKKHGHQVELFDTTFMDIGYLFGREITHEDLTVKLNFFKKVDLSRYQLAKKKVDVIKLFNEKIASYQPDFIAFSFWGSHLHAEGEFYAFFHGARIVELADTKDIPIVVGGTVPTWDTAWTLQQPKIHYVIRGEGELAFLEFADRITAGQSLSGMKNLWMKNGNGGIEKNELRPLIDPLDELPNADFDIYDKKTFFRPYHGKMHRCVDYELSRGCIYDCSFCLSPFQRKTYGNPKNFRREKSIVKIIDEIAYLKKRHKLEIIRYQDETFLTMKKEKLRDLSSAYKKHVGLPFIIEATINSITEEKIRYLKEMGCLSISLGLESGNPYIRDAVINKPKFTNDEAVKNIQIIKKSGMSLNVFNIMGFPEETKEMVFDTIGVNYRAKPPYCTACYFQPWEGTYLRDYSIKEGLLDSNLRGLDNSMESFMGSSLKNLKILPSELRQLHNTFTYYVYIHKIFWPLVKFVGKKGLVGRLITFLLTAYLKIRLFLTK